MAFWLLALALVSPWWVARYTTVVQPHPEHLPERFGLFTIILLGEGVAGGRNLRRWAYGHVPIYLGVFSLAAGTVAMAGEAAWTAQLFLLHVAGIALIPLGLAILRAAAPKSG